MRLHSLLHRALLIGAVISSLASGTAAAFTLYSTTFSNFAEPGDWAGTEGWESNALPDNFDTQGIFTSDVFGVKGGFLGFFPPTTTEDYIFVGKAFGFNPIAAGRPFVQVRTRCAVVDSNNGAYDLFSFVFLNSNFDPLGDITFNNITWGIERWDGVNVTDTGKDFANVLNRDFRYLDIIIDFAANRWSASLGGVPLFTNAVFNASGIAKNFGAFDFAWDIADVSNPGNNFLHVDDFSAVSFKVHPSQVPGIQAYIAYLQNKIEKAKKIKKKSKKKKQLRKLRGQLAYQASLL